MVREGALPFILYPPNAPAASHTYHACGRHVITPVAMLLLSPMLEHWGGYEVQVARSQSPENMPASHMWQAGSAWEGSRDPSQA